MPFHYLCVFKRAKGIAWNEHYSACEIGTKGVYRCQGGFVVSKDDKGAWINDFTLQELLLAERGYVLWYGEFNFFISDLHGKSR